MSKKKKKKEHIDNSESKSDLHTLTPSAAETESLRGEGTSPRSRDLLLVVFTLVLMLKLGLVLLGTVP